MKKLLTFVCMLACIFGLTACGSEKALTENEKSKVSGAELLSTQYVLPLLETVGMSDVAFLDEYTMEEIEQYIVPLFQYNLGYQKIFEADGYGFYTAAGSFHSGLEEVGSIQAVNGVSTKIDGDQIIVEVELAGEKKNATAELIYSNDIFLVLESAALNPSATTGELMLGAALNTLIGMGAVFAVLILISGIISCFRVIPKLQSRAAEKKAAKSAAEQNAGVDNGVAQIAAQEEMSDNDDLELAAVIAAAIAAYEGSASTDGYVVRSIRRLRQ